MGIIIMFEKNNSYADRNFEFPGSDLNSDYQSDTRRDVNSGIHCDVKSCVYHNRDHYCTLDRVSIGAVDTTDCSNSNETMCASFRPRD